MTSFRAVVEDHDGSLWVAGINSLGKLEDGKFELVLGPTQLNNEFVSGLAVTRRAIFGWAAAKGLLERSPSGRNQALRGARRAAGPAVARDSGGPGRHGLGRDEQRTGALGERALCDAAAGPEARCAACLKTAKAICGWARTTA